MTSNVAKRLRPFSWLAALATFLQLIGLIRYVSRLSDDWIGIALYIIILIALVLVSIGSFIQTR
jgi:hypothetical protein